MAYWQPINYRQKKVNRQYGDGINTYKPAFDIGESELTDSLNVCSDDYPAIRTRNDRIMTELPAQTNKAGLGQRNNAQFHVHNGVHWNYANTASTAYTQLSSSIPDYSESKFIEFNTESTKFTVLCFSNTTGIINLAYDGTTTLVSLTSDAPHSNLYTAYNFRLFGIENNWRTLKFSALGSITDWISSLNAGSIDLTNIGGPATAITTFNDHIVIWTERSMHELYGKSPTNYEIVQVSEDVGCVNNFAYVECNNILYFLNRDGIYRYTGGQPQKISQPVDKYVKNLMNYSLICAGTQGDKVYFSVPVVNIVQDRLIVYDTSKDKWSIETAAFMYMTNIGGWLYGIATNGRIWYVDSKLKTGYDTNSSGGSTAITYSFETKAYNDFNLDSEQYVDEMWINHDGTTNATLNVGMTTNINSTTFTTIIPSSDLTHSTQPIKEQLIMKTTDFNNVDYYKLQFKGTGHKRIYGVQMNTISYGGE